MSMIIKDASAFAPSNIAICKYWGKRSQELNLPVNSSLSISLGNKGAFTKVSLIHNDLDIVILNNQQVDNQNNFYQKIVKFLNLFRNQITSKNTAFKIDTHSNIPIAAGLASSACGFASLAKALDQLFDWNLPAKDLSILARLGSGSACRSLFHGFVKWHSGLKEDGTDSFAENLDIIWPDFCVGLLILDQKEKYLSSRAAMQLSVDTSPLYTSWTKLAQQDLITIENAIATQDFNLLGQTAEANALAMHSVMLSSRPAVMYYNHDTINNIQKIWQLRREHNIALYFTQDAGPNLKLLFLSKDRVRVKEFFPEIEIIEPFNYLNNNLILVDENDQEIGYAEKMAVHRTGALHRAFSAFVFREHNHELQLLLQKRHIHKYHSGNLWTNSCCGHPEFKENTIVAGERRIQEELGITVKLFEIGAFVYKHQFANGLIEHEFDHVLIGAYQHDIINPNPSEVDHVKWENIADFDRWLLANNDEFTVWLRGAWNVVKKNWAKTQLLLSKNHANLFS